MELKSAVPGFETKMVDFQEKTEKNFEDIKVNQLEKIKQNFEKKIHVLEENRKKSDKIKEEFEEKLKKEGQKFEEIRKFLFYGCYNFMFASETIKKGGLSLSNSNTTVENIKDNWSGVRCTVENPALLMMRSPDKLTFSIKIEKTSKARIMFGFCMKSTECDTALASNDNIYYSTKFSFMLSLGSSNFWSRLSSSKYITTPENIKQAAINNPQSVFSASLDIKKNQISFFMNGKLLEKPINIYLTPEESQMMMCPCMDIADKGDRVSLVFQELEWKGDSLVIELVN